MIRRAFLVGSVAWAALIPLGAFAASRADGTSTVYALALGVYSIGHVICHQLPARSFHLWATPLPVCARCSGIYLGAAATAILLSVSRAGRPVRDGDSGLSAPARVRMVFVAALVPTAATLAFEWTTGVTPANWVRALAGVPLGAAVAWAIGMVN